MNAAGSRLRFLGGCVVQAVLVVTLLVVFCAGILVVTWVLWGMTH